MKEAMYYQEADDKTIKCVLCPHNCTITDGNRGICKVRINKSGKLYSEVYERVVAIHTDPIEKKPLYHFYPGREILSIGTYGCNMKCFYCQNCDISQADPKNYSKAKEISVDDAVKIALSEENSIGIAFTYNEPSVYYEYMIDVAKKARDSDLKTVMVSNGYINQEPLEPLLNIIDAFNIDLKAFNRSFYKKHTKSLLSPVLDTIKRIAASGKHLEVTNLLIPGLNDDENEFREMVRWLKENTGEDTVLHISRYFPRYQSEIPSTSVNEIESKYRIAKDFLPYVYVGNMGSNDHSNTYCKACNNLLIKRSGYRVIPVGLDDKGNCSVCNNNLTRNI